MLVYIISDIDKSLPLEWNIENLSKTKKLGVILINCKNSKFELFLIKNKIKFQNVDFKKKYLDFFPKLFKIIFILYKWKVSIIHCHLRKASILGLVAGYILRIKSYFEDINNAL